VAHWRSKLKLCRFTLSQNKKGIKFHAGSEFTAADVVHCWAISARRRQRSKIAR
jgi:hypothetical protein